MFVFAPKNNIWARYTGTVSVTLDLVIVKLQSKLLGASNSEERSICQIFDEKGVGGVSIPQIFMTSLKDSPLLYNFISHKTSLLKERKHNTILLYYVGLGFF